MLRIAAAAYLSDTGKQREANEDSFFARSPVFAVADGMGGAQAGEVASRVAAEAFDAEPGEAPAEDFLRATAERANREIYELAQGDSSRSGMGTTLTAALVRGDEISFGHVGDSRAYVYRDRKLSQITNDHSLVEELRRQGKLTRDQAAEHPQRSVITRALGPEPNVEVDTMTYRARPGDIFLLCSDGLTTMLDDEDLLTILGKWDDLESAARRLVRAANDRGGRDNITVVLFRVEDAAATGEAAPVEGETLVGDSAEREGLTAAAVREGTAERRPRRREVAAGPGAQSGASGSRRWPRRLLKGAAALLVLAALAFGAVIGARQIWFIGTNEGDQVALYRGLPYELPFGLELYSEQASSTATLSSLPEDRRGVATDHELRSESDATSLIEDLERAAAEEAASRSLQQTGEGAAQSGGGASSAPGGSSSGGGGG